VSPTHADFLNRSTVDGLGKNRDWDRLCFRKIRTPRFPMHPVAIAPAPFRAGVPFPPQETCYCPAEVPVIGAHHDTTCPCHRRISQERATHPYERRTFNAHPYISSHRNVNNSNHEPVPGAVLHRYSGPALTPEFRRQQSLL